MNKEELEFKVKEKQEELVFCPLKDCKERGEYIKCYFDIYVNCDFYTKQKIYKAKHIL